MSNAATTGPDGVPLASVTGIQAEIEARLGFVPPFYEPAFGTPQVLDNLWRQTRSSYLDNPLPAHGGTILARARQGGGTELEFTLPIVDT